MLTPWVSKIICRGMRRVEHFMRNPLEVQEKTLLEMIASNADSDWGKQHQYKQIQSVERYVERVPVSTYESLQERIDRVRRGEDRLLTSAPTRWFAKSSGTTNARSKYIPINVPSLRQNHYAGMQDMLALYLNNYPDSRLFDGKSLVLGGSRQISAYGGFSEGDLSAILLQNMPDWASWFRLPNREISLMPDWEKKIERIATAAIKARVTNLSGVPSWMLLLLNRVAQKAGHATIGEVWPHLEVFFHGGVSFEPYRDRYQDLIQLPNMNYVESYNASEGFFAAQDQKGIPEMLLMLDYGVFYEFLPLEELYEEQPKVVQLADVVCDKNYAIIISTVGGLWRYLIGDTVRFTSLSPYRIVLTGRTKSFINAFGEELIVDNAEKALSETCRYCGVNVVEYTAAPCFAMDKNTAAHEWLIEFDKEPMDMNLFVKVFDEMLKSLNSDYEAKRYRDMILQPPIVHAAKRGTFYQWLRTKGKLGGQNKVPRLANDRKVLDDLLSLAQ